MRLNLNIRKNSFKRYELDTGNEDAENLFCCEFSSDYQTEEQWIKYSECLKCAHPLVQIYLFGIYVSLESQKMTQFLKI